MKDGRLKLTVDYLIKKQIKSLGLGHKVEYHVSKKINHPINHLLA